MQSPKTQGFTLVELLVGFSIIVLIVGFATIGFRNFATYQKFEQEVVAVKSALVEARVDARSAIGEEAHGIKFFTSSIVLFQGTTYSAVDPNNETVTFDTVTLIPTLTGGVDEIVFTQLTGLPSATGTIDVVGITFVSTTTLEVTAAGVIQ